MAATEVKGQICDGPIAEKFPKGMFLLYTKSIPNNWSIYGTNLPDYKEYVQVPHRPI